ncbi:MAG: hypothetical protein CMF57_12670 [Leifsonia sp.]|nr:hypothetical protein [Leifsonia sp.]
MASLTQNPTSRALPGDLRSYIEALHTGLPLRPSNVLAVTSLTRDLGVVERATCRIRVEPTPPRAIGPVFEAVARLVTLEARGHLVALSGQSVARTLQTALGYLYPNARHPHSLQAAALGWALLVLADAMCLIEVTVATIDPADARRYRRVRLHERIVTGPGTLLDRNGGLAAEAHL